MKYKWQTNENVCNIYDTELTSLIYKGHLQINFNKARSFKNEQMALTAVHKRWKANEK